MSGWPLKETERREPMIEVLGEGYSLHEKETELIRRACQTALTMEGARGDITVLIADPERIQTLNRDFRHVDRVTDVLTFPAWEGEAIFAPSDGYLGDIMICMERAKEQAEEFGHSLERELAFLAVMALCTFWAMIIWSRRRKPSCGKDREKFWKGWEKRDEGLIFGRGSPA